MDTNYYKQLKMENKKLEKRIERIREIVNDTPGLLQVKEEWCRFLYHLKYVVKPKTYVEIGIWNGAGLATVQKLMPECRLIGIDVLRPDQQQNNEQGDTYFPLFEFIQGNSHDEWTYKQLLGKLQGERADVVFIDGLHHFDDVYQDWKDYGLLGKHVGFHDITDSEYSRRGGFYVHFLWEFLKTQYEGKEFVLPNNNIPSDERWGGIGILDLNKKLGTHPLPTDIT